MVPTLGDTMVEMLADLDTGITVIATDMIMEDLR